MALWDAARWDSGHWSTVEGYMAATETGSDTFAASGVTNVVGDLAATETTSDIFSANGTTQVIGNLAATEATSDTFSAEGVTQVLGSMAAVETTSDTFAAEGVTQVVGALAATETTSDTFSAEGITQVVGVLDATESTSDTFAATGEVTPHSGVIGYMAAQEIESDIFAATGTVTPQPVPPPPVIADVGDERQRKKAQKKRDEAFEKYRLEQKKLRETIEAAVDPMKAQTVPVVVSEGKKQIEVLSADGGAVSIAVPQLFNAAEVARVVAEVLEDAKVAAMQVKRRQDAERALALARVEMARIIKRKRDDEFLLLMD